MVINRRLKVKYWPSVLPHLTVFVKRYLSMLLSDFTYWVPFDSQHGTFSIIEYLCKRNKSEEDNEITGRIALKMQERKALKQKFSNSDVLETTCRPCENAAFDLESPGWGLRFCIANKLPGDAKTAGPQMALWIASSQCWKNTRYTPRSVSIKSMPFPFH